MLRLLLGVLMLCSGLSAAFEEDVPTLFMAADFADTGLYLQEKAKHVSIDIGAVQPQDVTIRDLAERVDRLVSERG